MSEKTPEATTETRSRRGLNRRRFCQLIGISACGIAAGGASALTVDYLRPRVLFEPPTRFELVPADALSVGDVIQSDEHRVYLMRLANGFRALSAVCTHLGCITRFLPDEGIIACPCHGSRFNLDGEVIAGPAPRPLPWFQVDLSPRGYVVVDTAVSVPLGTTFKL